MSELKDSFKRLFIFYGRSEKEAERLAELAAEPPLGYRWSKVKAKPKTETDGRFYEGKPKLSRAEVDRRFYEVKNQSSPTIRMASSTAEQTIELREESSGCIVAIGGKEVAR